MDPPLLALLFALSTVIGCVAAVMGVGGGLFIVPALTLFDVPLREAAGAGLVCTLATSAAGSVALDKARLSIACLVVQLELAAGVGVLIGAYVLAAVLPERVVAGTFAVFVLYAAARLHRRRPASEDAPAAAEAPGARLLGWAGFAGAGLLCGVLGIGGGPFKVPLQTELLRVPLRVALANSNLMVGITGAVGAAAYYGNGWISAGVSAPCALGTAAGAYVGGLLAPRIPAHRLRVAFVGLLLLVAGRMAWKALAPAG